jgi:hypothetical protein
VYQREMVLYTRGRSLRCWRARRFLERAGYSFKVVEVGGDPEMLARLSGGRPPRVCGAARVRSARDDSHRTCSWTAVPWETWAR